MQPTSDAGMPQSASSVASVHSTHTPIQRPERAPRPSHWESMLQAWHALPTQYGFGVPAQGSPDDWQTPLLLQDSVPVQKELSLHTAETGVSTALPEPSQVRRRHSFLVSARRTVPFST
jgi:hypothetical protein